jgi:hypothetical protein
MTSKELEEAGLIEVVRKEFFGDRTLGRAILATDESPSYPSDFC